MAAPSFRSRGTARSASGSTLTFDVPAGVQAGDIIWIPIYIGDPSISLTGLDGFALVADTPLTIPANQRTVAIWRRAASSDGDGLGEDDGDVYSITASGSTFYEGAAHAIMDCVASGDPWDPDTDGQVNAVASTTTPAVSITTSESDTLNLWYGSCWAGGPWTPPTGFTETLDANVGVNTAAYRVQSSAGASGSVSGTSAQNDKMTAWLGSLRPVSAAPNEGSVALTLVLAVAAVGARRSAGVAAVGLALAVSAVGARRSAGVAALGLALAVSGAGARASRGVAAVGLGLAVAATGRRASRGAAALGLRLAVNASGVVTQGRPSKLTARSRTEALRARGASVRLIARGGYPDA